MLAAMAVGMPLLCMSMRPLVVVVPFMAVLPSAMMAVTAV